MSREDATADEPSDTRGVDRTGEPTGDVDHEARDSGTDVDEEAEYDADEPHAEWVLWIAAIVIVVGAGLLLAPEGMVPELAVGLAPLLILVAVVGFVGQWFYHEYR